MLAAPDEKRYLDTIVSLTGLEIPLLELAGIATPEVEEEPEGPSRGRRGRGAARKKQEPGAAKPAAKTAKPAEETKQPAKTDKEPAAAAAPRRPIS